MTAELKPCPFCGGKLNIHDGGQYSGEAVKCASCEIVFMGFWSDSQESLAAKVNARSDVERLTAYSNGLEAALSLIASLGYGENEWVANGHEDAYRAIERHKAEQVKHPTALSAITARPEDEVWNEAIEAAAEACDDYPRAAPDENEWPHYDDQIAYSQDCIRSLKRPVKGESHE